MHTTTEAVLESFWDVSEGVLAHIREGEFSSEASRDMIAYLKSLDFCSSPLIPRRTVALLWYMPLFLQWQSERVRGKSPAFADEYEQFTNAVQREVERLLGLP